MYAAVARAKRRLPIDRNKRSDWRFFNMLSGEDITYFLQLTGERALCQNEGLMKDNPIVQLLLAVVIFILGASLGGMYVKIETLQNQVKNGGTAAVGANPAVAGAVAPEAP